MTEPAIERPVLPRLTSLRAFAAVSVFFFHVAREYHWGPAGKVFAQGDVGVAFFFVLSGFVLTWTARPDDTAQGFYVRRVARIYPVYLVTLLGIALLRWSEVPMSSLILSVLLLQAWVPTQQVAFGVNAPAWSLSCEAAFYAAFPWLRRRLAAPLVTLWLTVAVWLLVDLAVAYLSIHYSAWQLLGLINPLVRAGEFFLGMVIAEAVTRGLRGPRLSVAMLFLALALAASRALNIASPEYDALLAPFFGLAIASAATADLAGVRGLLQSRPLTYLGEISFAFYLIHSYVLDRVGAHRTDVVGIAVALFLAVVLSAALHHAVERPARGWIAVRLSRQRLQVAA